MLHGKKGFERIIWACRNVLDHSLTCLFHDRTAGGTLAASEALGVSARGKLLHMQIMLTRCRETSSSLVHISSS